MPARESRNQPARESRNIIISIILVMVPPLLLAPRLQLRELRESDADAVFRLRTDPRVNTYLDRAAVQHLAEAREFIRRIRAGQTTGQWYYWAISLQDSSELVGTVCLWNFSADKLHAEIGYELLPDYQGQGLMQEALCEVIDFAYRELWLHRISAFTHRENAASIRLLMRLGFEPAAAAPDQEMHSYVLTR